MGRNEINNNLEIHQKPLQPVPACCIKFTSFI